MTGCARCHQLVVACLQVPFEQVPDLVAGRRVFLQAGFAFVSKDQMSSLVVQPFRCERGSPGVA